MRISSVFPNSRIGYGGIILLSKRITKRLLSCLKNHTSQMLNNWLEILLDFDFDVIHRPGILNILPDAISWFYDADPQVSTIPVKIWALLTLHPLRMHE